MADPGRPSNSLHFVVGEMSGKLDQVLSTLLVDREQVREQFGAHDQRLTRLERWQWRMLGGGSVIVFLVSTVEAWHYHGR